MDLISQVTEIFLLGVVGGAAPGPIQTSVLTEVLKGGLVRGVKVVLRALVAEVIVATAALTILFFLNMPQFYFEILSVFGALFIFYLAFGIWKIDKIGDEKGEIFTFSKIFFLTVLNSGFCIFWLTVCAPRAFALGRQIAYGEVMFLIAFEAGWLAVTLLLAVIFSKFRPLLLQKNLISPVFKFFALILIFFSLRSIFESAAYFLK